MLTQEKIEQQLSTLVDPYMQQDWVSTKCIKQVEINGSTVTVNVVLGYPVAGSEAELIESARHKLLELPEVEHAEIQLNWHVIPHAVQQGMKGLDGVKNIIAVASGKGGVGKSTTSVNLALALVAEGAQVGILDADIYGPSQPLMLGSQQQPESKEDQLMEPVVCYGLQTMSIGYLVDTTTPMVWRGPMVSTALQQLLHNTRWHDLDYLVVDLPPGTGDIQLTLAQKIPVSGALIVTTPQDLALLDVRKAVGMFNKVKVPVLGVVENMSTHVCSQCGHEEPIFGAGGGEKVAQEFGVDLLGQLPLDMRIREQTDSGKPTVVAAPESSLAQNYCEVAKVLAAKLSLQSKNYTSKFPKIVVE